ncbi:hypothetical protein [Cupriavidus sp. BIS7]|uniref:hypothetical protein n=1 Tax=Cupriavidus sp. BIS7 TaxID=1217718 RepID=UPI0012F6230A|nr:hypothetical protein [Cupriavidus sp. BIS7]
MLRHHSTLLLLSAIAAISTATLAPAANAAGRPGRDTGVACARAENTYCLSGGNAVRQDAPGSRADRLHRNA